MRNYKASTLLKRLFPQILIQSISIILTAFAACFIMAWLIVDIADVKNIYLAALYEALGILLLIIIAFSLTYIYVFQKRLTEVNTLLDAITKVSRGDFDYRIDIRKKEPLTQIYEDFNNMTAQLASVKILQNDFINNYSHEFKTPIASINGFASLLLERDVSKENAKLYLEIIRDESERLSLLATNTILLSKLSSQQIVTEKEDYNIGEQLRQCAIIYSQAMSEKNISFKNNLLDTNIYANKEILQHLWLNLLGNALKFTPAGGEITLALYDNQENIKVIVKDTGEGMSEETLTHLFNPYYQGDSSHSTQGLGLGLAICHRIVELFNGKIEVESKLGVGSRFTVTLPKNMTIVN